MPSTLIDLWCQDVVEMVTRYLEQGLTAEERVRFEKHLLACPPCTTYLAQMRTTLELAGELAGAPPAGAENPGDLEPRLLLAFRRRQGRGPGR